MNNKKFKKFLGFILFALIIVLIEFLDVTPKELKTSIKSVNNQATKVEKRNIVDGTIEVSFIDVGQGDSILIQTGDHSMLIDGGNNSDGKLLVEYFKSLGIKKFDYVVGTHPHEDHIGGLDNIISSFDIGTIYMPKVATTTKTFEDVLDVVKEKNLQIFTPSIGDKFYLGDAKVEVLSVKNDASDLNDTSIVLRLEYGNVSYIFMGDASTKIEKELLNKNIESDVLKVGHHGSEYSTDINFLKKVNPKYAIISVGENNIYDHPKTETLEKLESLNIETYRTDELGTIKTISDGNDIKFSYERTDTNG